ncbi:uncharacterized protein [Clytia hemisphaerica]|uniref:uncharacterized protein n=1 Tax=Clytia hemisphaerica TaxID=252671 RepID=UPI0034D7932C
MPMRQLAPTVEKIGCISFFTNPSRFISGGRPCSAVTTGTSRGRLTKSYSLQHTKNELIEPKRLKHRDTGLCFEVESGTEYIIRTSRCRDSFYLAPDEPFLIHVQSGKKVGQRAGETKLQLVNNESDAKIFTLTYVSVTSNGKSGQKKKLGMYPTQEDYQGKTQCMEYPNSPTYITFGPITTPKSTGFCGDKLAFIRAFPQEITDKISMKSMLKISTSKGSTLFVCTPSKDLWSNSNCLYSLDDGAKWIGTSSSSSRSPF